MSFSQKTFFFTSKRMSFFSKSEKVFKNLCPTIYLNLSFLEYEQVSQTDIAWPKNDPNFWIFQNEIKPERNDLGKLYYFRLQISTLSLTSAICPFVASFFAILLSVQFAKEKSKNHSLGHFYPLYCRNYKWKNYWKSAPFFEDVGLVFRNRNLARAICRPFLPTGCHLLALKWIARP